MVFTCIATAQESGRVLFDFSGPNAASQWQIVNDGVMGGRSSSRAEMKAEGQMWFKGNLSLENNGGFASVRSRPKTLGLARGQSIVLRVLGDGRKYTFNLYLPDRRTAFSYRREFETIPGKWAEVRMPLDQFVATSFGRTIANDRLDPTRIDSLGILLGDKRPGPFEIRVDWIKVE
jgi:monofunctional biosynthetic peptidoglycan transglycosylase